METNTNQLSLWHRIRSFFGFDEAAPLTDPKYDGHEGFSYRGHTFIHYTKLSHHESAFYRLNFVQAIVIVMLVLVLFVGLFLNWHTTLVVLVTILTLLYFLDLIFNLFLVYRSFARPMEVKISAEKLAQAREWPSYTIFCPLYHEADVVPQFVKAMGRLDYPHEKLQVMLLLEADDVQTIEQIKKFDLPSYFEIVVVPHSFPKTKPKALNYGLKFAKGEYTVIFDAEDIPDPDQLKKAIIAFSESDDKTICIQAKLNFYNPHQNLLTRVFTAEYSLWFDLVLTGLQSIKAPIPLGGTSNHFRTQDLHDLKGWDSFNVTEDSDLGMRLVKRGYHTAIIDSTTNEEANSNLFNWFNQRTRWIKGYMQTYLVHMRRPQDFLREWKRPHAITFQLIIGGKVLSMFINPVMWVITISYFALRPIVGDFIESLYPAPVLYMGIFSLVIGNFLYMYYYMIGCYKRDHDKITKYMFLVPIYWLFMSIAAWNAVIQIIHKPHFWPKTRHGLHLKNKKAVAHAESVVGTQLTQTPALSVIENVVPSESEQSYIQRW